MLFISLFEQHIYSRDRNLQCEVNPLSAISPRILEKLGSSERTSLRDSAASFHQSLHYLHNSHKLEQEDLASYPFTIYQRDSRNSTLTLMSVTCSAVKQSK